MALTKSQKEAVHNTEGITLINAGAGAGKTTAFTARIANLVANKKVDPAKILALTFTNEAANNMKAKLAKLIGKTKADSVELSTFHSYAYKILKSRYANAYKGKNIVQQWWKFSKLYDLIAVGNSKNPIGLDMDIGAGDLAGFISYQKSNMIKGGQPVIVDERVSYVSHVEVAKLQSAYDTYCSLVKNARVLEFDDMLMDFYYYLKDDKELLEDIKNQFDFIMVDEFQDTNLVNMEILKMINNDNLFVVGDFRQGIYGFINANIDNILTFQDEFQNTNLIELRENFRSTRTIVEFCNTVIDVAPVEKYKKFSHQLAARKEVGDPVSITYYKDESTETKTIADQIEQAIEDDWGASYSDFAILCRTNAQLGMYESILADRDIPCDVSSSKSFFDRKEISDLLAYAAHTIDPSDDMSLRKIINSPNRFVSKALTNSLDEFAFSKSISLEQALTTMDTGRSSGALSNLVSVFEDLREKEELNANKFLREVYNRLNYKTHLEKKSTSHTDLILREEAVEKLFDIAKKFTNINAFLGHISVIKNNNNRKKGENGAVNLLTVHSSKGLEFDHVFVPAVTSENFPHQMNQDVEEERRLFYVALSRAKENLSVSTHVFVGSSQAVVQPSPFLIDVIGGEVKTLRKKVLHGQDYADTSFKIDKNAMLSA